MRLRRKAWQLSWRNAMSGSGKLKFAGVGALVFLMTVGGGVGVYAYSSPEVNVMHPLYPIKQGIESSQLYLAPNAKVKAELQLQNAKRRVEEVRMMGQMYDNAQETEEGMNRTLQMVRTQMNESLAFAAQEDSVGEAMEAMDMMQQQLRDMDTYFSGLSQTDMMRERQMIKAHLDDLHQYTQLKLKKIDQVTRQISSPMRIKGPRVIMRCLTDDGQGFQDIDITDVPVVIPAPDMPENMELSGEAVEPETEREEAVQPIRVEQYVITPERTGLRFGF